MGQYWKLVNLDKKEFVHPHKLGTGLKLWECLVNSPGIGAAMIILQAAMPEQRGGGDLSLSTEDEDYNEIAKRTIGRWAGDRVVMVGDYAEDSDLPRRQKASQIYGLCVSKEDWVENIKDLYRTIKKLKAGTMYSNELSDKVRDTRIKDCEAQITKLKSEVWYNLYNDISDDVCRVIEYEFNGRFSGEGWRDFTRNKD